MRPYIPTWAGFLYLAIVLDEYSRRIVGSIDVQSSPYWACGVTALNDKDC